MRICQVVISDAFAGAERYVCELSRGLVRAGHEVVLVGGGDDLAAHVPVGVTWRPARSIGAGIVTLAGAGRFDVVNAHLTWAEAVAIATKPRHGALVVSTRHLLTPRGRSRLGRLGRPLLERHLDAEIAVSQAVADTLDRRPRFVIRSGVATRPTSFHAASRTVLVAQRLEAEKRTDVALEAWFASGLVRLGWNLVIAGQGSERARLEQRACGHPLGASVRFVGHVADLEPWWSRTGILLAATPIESLGLTVLEAMARGIPVVAAASGGHLETVGRACPDLLFPPNDSLAAAAQLAHLGAGAPIRQRIAAAVQRWQQENATLSVQVDTIAQAYRALVDELRAGRTHDRPAATPYAGHS